MLQIVVGAQWGDEGKGKIVDYLSRDVDAVARFQGGNNAGHTVVVADQTLKLHLIPSGIASGKPCFLGNGMVIDPWALVYELDELMRLGLSPELTISAKAHLILPQHLRKDTMQEKRRGSKPIGTTGRGIGPAYSDKASRIGLRVETLLLSKDDMLEECKVFLQRTGYHEEKSKDEFAIASSTLAEELWNVRHHLRDKIGDVSTSIRDLLSKNRKVLAEGAQGTLLGLDHGTYPFCTSSNTIAAAACVGLGLPTWVVSEIYGVIKAYTTRVGKGPFPTELKNDVGENLAQNGKEFGTTTGRKRRCGWLDLVALRYAHGLNGFTKLTITKLDVLSGLDTLKICVAYSVNGEAEDNFPLNSQSLENCVPIYKEFPGWKDPGVRGWDSIVRKDFSAMPEEAKHYLDFISKSLNVPIRLVSVGPRRKDTVEITQ